MHCYDLGILQVAVPSVLQEMTEDETCFAGPTLQARYTRAYKDYRRWFKHRHTRSVIGKRFLVKTWRKSSAYPHITQLTAKAAALRSMSYWLAEVCRTHAPRNEAFALRSAMLNSFMRADVVNRNNGKHLNAVQHRLFCGALENALVCYNSLASSALRDGRLLYKVIPKFHAITHFYDAQINARRVACYPDEDMVGRVKRIYVRCHGATAPVRTLQRYHILVCIRWMEVLARMRGIE